VIVVLLGLALLLFIKAWYEWLWAGASVPLVIYVYPLLQFATLVVKHGIV
jgi:hypothetical protein